MSEILTGLVNGMLASGALSFVVWMILRLMPRNSLNAATRYAIWCAVLAVTAALPFSYARLSKRVASSPPALVVHNFRYRAVEVPYVQSAPVPAPARRDTSKSANLPTTPGASLFQTVFPIAIPAGPWPPRIFALWLLATSLMLIRLMSSAALLERRKVSALEPPTPLSTRVANWIAICGGSNRHLRLAISREVSVPVLSGPVHAAILLPARLLDELGERDLEQIGIHEAAHFVRCDDYALLIQRTVEALFALHPVVHWISRRIDLEREIACDDFVIAATGASQPYAACLARVVELSGGIRATTVAAAAAEDTSHLARRVAMILDITRHKGTRLLGLRLAVAAACITALGWGAAQTPGFVSFKAPARTERAMPAPTEQRSPRSASANTPILPQHLLLAQISRPAVPATTPVPTQPAATTPLPAQSEVASGNSDGAMVYVPVTVRDPQGRFVTGLGKEVFRVSEDGVEQNMTQLAIEDSRADLFVLVAAEVNPDATLQPLLEESIRTTQVGNVVQVHGMGQLTPQSSPTQAIQAIQSRLRNISQRQMALIVANSSAVSQRHTASELDDAVGKIGMPVYVLDVSGPDDRAAPDNGYLPAFAFLNGLASRTGGEYFAVKQQDVPNRLSAIVIALRNMYFLGYKPSNPARDGSYRSLQVDIQAPRGLPALTAHYRPGYNAPAQ